MRNAALLLFVVMLVSLQGLAQEQEAAPPSNLTEAIERGDAESVKQFLASGVDPNIPDEQRLVPLLLAIEGGHEDVVEVLLTFKGLNVDVEDVHQDSALELAIDWGQENIAMKLIEAGATFPSWVLFSAASDGMATLTREALKRTPDELNARGRDGLTPLHFAVLGGHVEVVRVLLEAGADRSIRDDEGRTARDWALAGGVDELVGLFGGYGTGSPFLDAIVAGEYEIVKEELEADSTQANQVGLDGKPALHQAVLSGTQDLVELLLGFGADPNARDAIGQTPLHLAAQSGLGAVCELLLGKGARSDARDQNDWTPVHCAAAEGSVNVMEQLVLQGADLEAKTKENWAPLHLAVASGQEEMAAYLLKKGAEVSSLGKNGDTPLHVAVQGRQHRILTLLLEHGASVNATGQWDKTPLHYAASTPGNLEAAKLLVEHGADLEACSGAQTPLMVALSYYFYPDYPEQIEVAKYLISQGANVNPRTDGGFSPLHSACMKRRGEVVRLLVAKGANLDATAYQGKSPLWFAVENADKEIIEVLLEAGARVPHAYAEMAAAHYSKFTSFSLTEDQLAIIALLVEHGARPVDGIKLEEALCQAVEAGDVEAVRAFLDQGADVNTKGCYGSETPLSRAIWKNQIGVAKALLEYGAEVDPSTEPRGPFPLAQAAALDKYEIFQLLLAHGADPLAVNPGGYTALHSAASGGDTRLAAILLDKGADINARNVEGGTPLHSAASSYVAMEMVRFLVDRGADVNARDSGGMTPLGITLKMKKFHDREAERVRQDLVRKEREGKPVSRPAGKIGAERRSDEFAETAAFLREHGAVE